jgi:hypothetical protein
MHCILCHNNQIFANPKTQARKGLIIYNKTNAIATLRKHVNFTSIFKKRFEDKVNCPLKQDERKLSIKRPNISYNFICNFFATKEPFLKNDV